MLKRLVVLAAAAVVAVSVVLFAWAPFATEHPQRADAIVVLAGSGSRLPVGLDLFHRGVAPVLAISRDARDVPRRRFCRLPSTGAFCFDARPYSTRGEARAIARLARARHWRSVVVVSSRFHLFRVRLLVRRCTDVRLQLVPAAVRWWYWPLAMASEWTKLAVAETTRRGC